MKSDALKAKYAHISDEGLEEIIAADDHRIERDLEMGGNFVHISSDCETCEAEEVADLRLRAMESTLPGYLPVLRGCVLHSIPVKDLKVGAFARYNALPGLINRSHYVECVSVEVGEEEVKASWVRTNSDDEPFSVTYPADIKVDVVEKFPA